MINPQQAYEIFLDIFLNLYNQECPIEEKNIKEKTLNCPWMTQGLIKSSRRKQKLYNKFLKNKTVINEEHYKAYRRLFESTKYKSKKSYYNGLIEKYKNDMRAKWKVMKEIIGKTK